MKKICITGLIAWLLFLPVTACIGGEATEDRTEAGASGNQRNESKRETRREWVVKWKGEEDLSFRKSVMVLHETAGEGGTKTMLVRLKAGVDEDRWSSYWSAHENVEFIHPNHKYKVEERESSSRSLTDRDYYLDLIRANEAGERIRDSGKAKKEVVVAVVDTGIDLEHPALKPYLVEGVNLKETELPPQDHMGHGTHVAGVVTAVWKEVMGADSRQGSARLMPVKVMSDGQDGDVYFTAEGIRAAVRKGADVIVLSQGSWTYSETIADAVKLAEEKGVVVVGAAGNASFTGGGGILYNRPLYYPAALPTVIGVGSVGTDGKYVPTSNTGPGIDVVAPGESIWAAVPGGKYGADSGTSFAAPQVAALAALIVQKHPDMTPADVRNLIRQTATPGENTRWNERYGFGLIDVHAALTSFPKGDIFEPNNSPSRSMPMSLDQTYQAVLDGKEDKDCFLFQVRNSGTLTLEVKGRGDSLKRVRLETVVQGDGRSTEYDVGRQREVHLTVPKGELVACLSAPDASAPIRYALSNSLRAEPDTYENNDYQWNAYKMELSPGITFLEGTLHKRGDNDWYRFDIPEPGRLKLRVDVRTPRVDPVLYIQEKGGWRGFKRDEEAEGKPEKHELKVAPGSLYIRVSDYGTNPIPEPYQLIAEYQPESQDIYEPNNISTEAILLTNGEEAIGTISSVADLDWYTFMVSSSGKTAIRFSKSGDWSPEVTLYDSDGKVVAHRKFSGKERGGEIRKSLHPGTYLIRVRGDRGDSDGRYHIRFAESSG